MSTTDPRTGLDLAMVRARRALERAGLDPGAALQRTSSVTNEVWLATDVVVRVNNRADLRLRREASLAPHLPEAVGYPGIVAYGDESGWDWLIVPRVPGRPLSRCWPTMSPTERRSAVADLTARLRSLHGTRSPVLPPLDDPPHPLDPAVGPGRAVARLLTGLRTARGLPHVDLGIISDLAELVVADVSYLAPFAVPTLVHGDLTFENVLWDGQRISAVLDFEYARPGPPDLDLDVLLRMATYPFLHVAADYEHLTRPEDYAELPFWLAEDYPELFDHPNQFERMRLYAVGWEVRALLRQPPDRPFHDLHPHHPYQRLVALVRGTSHLDHLAGRVSITF